MCSWCYGFRSVRDQVIAHAGPQTRVRYVMGGLAADSNEPMPETMRGYVQEAWRAVAATTGVSFNWDFWSRCTPRRSTYASCRAVIAAGGQGPQLFDRIQRAYYEEARNPSDEETLVACAEDPARYQITQISNQQSGLDQSLPYRPHRCLSPVRDTNLP